MFKERFVKLLQNTTAYQFAKATGFSNGIISRWKTGEVVPSFDNLIKLADYFGVSIDYLVGRTDKPEVNK